MRIVVMASALAALLLLILPSSPEATPSSQKAAPSSQKAEKKIKAVIVFESHLGRVKFTHKDHVDEHGADCDACHHAVQAKPIKTPHDGYFAASRIDCKACHTAKKGQGATQACRACHYDYSKSKGCADETLSPMLATHKKCWDCHDRGEGVKATKACKACHKGPTKPW